MAVRCICVDDEPLARQGIKLALRPFPDFSLIGEFSSVDDVFENMPTKVDVVFLDIEMPRQNGFALLEQWPEPAPIIVFVTAYNRYAIQAFENQALDYLLKPIDQERFAHVVDRIRNGLAQKTNASTTRKLLQTIEDLRVQVIKSDAEVTLKTDEGYLRIKTKDVLFLEGIGDHVCFHLKDKQLITRSTLKKYVAEFSEQSFIQTHKSFLVNSKHVEKIEKLRFGDYIVHLSNGSTVKLSRRYKDAIRQFIKT